jgi:hypothetical protein
VGHNVVDTLHGKNPSINQEEPNVQNNVIGNSAWNPSDHHETQSIHEFSPVVPPRKQKCFKIPTLVNGVVIMSKNDYSYGVTETPSSQRTFLIQELLIPQAECNTM